MPRYKISKKQEYFDLLVSLLDRHDSSSEVSWGLIQMLATNENLYKRVLELETARDTSTGNIDWTKFFDSHSLYKLLYTLQIIEAVMEEGEDEGGERIKVHDEEKIVVGKNVPRPPPIDSKTVVLPPHQDKVKDIEEVAGDKEPVEKKLEKKKTSMIV